MGQGYDFSLPNNVFHHMMGIHCLLLGRNGFTHRDVSKWFGV